MVLLEVKHHRQDTSTYCGAACAQMVCGWKNVGVLPQNGDIARLIHHHNLQSESGWETDPAGLTGTLNQLLNPPSGEALQIYQFMSKIDLARAVVWSVHRGMPASILFFDRFHWVLVVGYDIGGAVPASASDTGYTIRSLIYHDPWITDFSSHRPPPHLAEDDCGSGGNAWGYSGLSISLDAWMRNLHSVDSGNWVGKYIGVGAHLPPAIPAAAPGPELVSLTVEGDVLDLEPSLADSPGESVEAAPARLIAKPTAKRRAMKGLLASEPDRAAEWKRTLNLDHAETPKLVQRLDLEDTFYYIVAFRFGRATPVVVALDAKSGEFIQAAWGDKKANLTASFAFDPRKRVKNRAAIVTLPGPAGGTGLVVRKEASVRHPTLVWRPCRESRSPFAPFEMTIAGERRFFTRADGAVFTELTVG